MRAIQLSPLSDYANLFLLIAILRLLSELHREFERRRNVAYFDIKAAFDCVDSIAFWMALRSYVVTGILPQLILDFHQNTGARVHVGQKLSKRFQTSSGARQGCILAPALFCVATDWILQHVSMKHGIQFR